MTRQVIWKQVLKLDEVRDYDWPAGAEPIAVAGQGRDLCVWYRCDPDRVPRPRRFAVVGTGHREIDSSMTYLGTAHFEVAAGPNTSRLVLHVFEVPLVH